GRRAGLRRDQRHAPSADEDSDVPVDYRDAGDLCAHRQRLDALAHELALAFAGTRVSRQWFLGGVLRSARRQHRERAVVALHATEPRQFTTNSASLRTSTMHALRTVGRWIFPALIGVAFASCGKPAEKTPVGVWDASITVGQNVIPFKFEVTGTAPNLSGSFFDGDLKRTSTGGQYSNGALVLPFPEYGSRVNVVYKDDRLDGT